MNGYGHNTHYQRGALRDYKPESKVDDVVAAAGIKLDSVNLIVKRHAAKLA